MKYEVIVVGGGMAGLSCALGLAQNDFKVAVVESGAIIKEFEIANSPRRVSAINTASQNFLKQLGVWREIVNARVSEYVAMNVWDQNSSAKLQLKAEDCSLMNLGAIVENDLIVAKLYQALKLLDVCIFESSKIEAITQSSQHNILTLADGNTLEGGLLVGADGANSFIRQSLDFSYTSTPYNHCAIVTNVKSTNKHDSAAYQRFLRDGVLALLPLSDPNLCSIVYSFSSENLSKFNAMTDRQFSDHLTVVSEGVLGELRLQNKRMSFELIERHVQTYYKQGVVLVADAAHTIHPLAGQGINLGFADVAALIDVLVETQKLQRNIADISTLAKYAHKRKFENQLMLKAMSGLKQLFCNDHALLRPLRAFGLNTVNDSKLLKQFFIERAAGL